MSNNLKQIKDFDLQSSVADTDQFVLQTDDGVTLKATKSGILNEVNASLIGLQSQVDGLNVVVDTNEIRGQEECLIGVQIYTIPFGTTVSNPIPLVSLHIPDENAIIYVQGIYDVTSTSFKVVLSSSPKEEGYYINWSVRGQVTISGGNNALSLLDLTDIPDVIGSEGQVLSISGGTFVFSDVPTPDLSNYLETSVFAALSGQGGGTFSQTLSAGSGITILNDIVSVNTDDLTIESGGEDLNVNGGITVSSPCGISAISGGTQVDVTAGNWFQVNGTSGTIWKSGREVDFEFMITHQGGSFNNRVILSFYDYTANGQVCSDIFSVSPASRVVYNFSGTVINRYGYGATSGGVSVGSFASGDTIRMNISTLGMLTIFKNGSLFTNLQLISSQNHIIAYGQSVGNVSLKNINLSIQASTAISLTNTGVTAGSYTNSSITVDSQGRITSASSGNLSSYATTTTLSSISGNLQSQITTNSNSITGLVSISGNHNTRITNLETYTSGITGGVNQLDTRYVNVTGDTLTGTLYTRDLIPTIANTYSLGTSAFPYSDLFLSPSTIHLGSDTISVVDNRLNFNDSYIVSWQEVSISGNYTVNTNNNLIIKADTINSFIDISIATQTAGQRIKVIDVGEFAGTHIITITPISGSIEGLPSKTIENNGGTLELIYNDEWEISDSFTNFFNRNASTGIISPVESDTLAVTKLFSGNVAESFTGTVTDFSNAEANVSQSVNGWGNTLITQSDNFNLGNYNTNHTSPYTVSASTEYPSYEAWKAFDGVFTGVNAWVSNTGQGIGAWVKIDLGTTRMFTRFRLKGYDGGNPTVNPTAYTLHGSTDNSNWIQLYTVSGIPAREGYYDIVDIPSPALYRYYRVTLDALNSGTWGAIGEVLYYEGVSATTTNTFQYRPITSGDTKIFSLPTLSLLDETNTQLANGDILIEYSTNGSTWSPQYSLNDFKALGNISSDTFWFRFEMVGDNRLKQVTIQTSSSYAQMQLNGMEIVVDSVKVAEITNNGANLTGNLTTTGYISGSTYYGDGSNLTGIPTQSQVNTISGDLDLLETYTSGITGGLNQLNNTFVNVSGDTMTGTLYVPTIGSHINPVTEVHLNQCHLEPISANPPHEEGLMFYDGDKKVLKMYNDIPDVALDIGEENWVRIVNKTGSTISNGQVVYINGAQGNRPTVDLADKNSPITAESTIGMATHDIVDNEEGLITTFGLVREVNTDGYTNGDTLWVDTNGGYTNVKPTVPIHAVRVGYVVVAHQTQGIVLVSVDTGSDIGQLHDVFVTNVQNGDLLTYSQAISAWTNTNDIDVSGYIRGSALNYSTKTANYTTTATDGGTVVYISGGPTIILNQSPIDGEHLWIANDDTTLSSVISGGVNTIQRATTKTILPDSTFHLHYKNNNWRTL